MSRYLVDEPRNTRKTRKGFMNSINGGVTVTAAITNREMRETRESWIFSGGALVMNRRLIRSQILLLWPFSVASVTLCDVLLETNRETREKREKGFPMARRFCINGGITGFETRFASDSQK